MIPVDIYFFRDTYSCDGFFMTYFLRLLYQGIVSGGIVHRRFSHDTR